MDPTKTRKGWAALQPLDEHAPLVNFPIPLDIPARYVVSSRSSDSVSLLVPESEVAPCQPIEATLVINENGEVFVERPDGPNRPVLINGQAIDPGSGSRVPLRLQATVSFDAWSYLYVPAKGIVNGEALEKVANVRRCNVCRMMSQDAIYILSCGHNICAKCRREATLAPSGRIAQGRQIGRMSHPLVPVGQPQGRIEMAMHCGLCRARVTAAVASAAIPCITGNAAAKVAAELEQLDENRPLCDGCQNQRGLIESRDYVLCETCQQMVCPPCLIQWHRRHKLQPVIQRLRDLDEVEHKLAEANRSLAVLEREQQELTSNKEVIKILESGKRDGEAMVAAMHSLNGKLMQCREQLRHIKMRKRALGRCWDETSREMAAAFNRHVEKFGEVKRYVEQLRDREMFLSIGSNSEEADVTSAATPPATQIQAIATPGSNATSTASTTSNDE